MSASFIIADGNPDILKSGSVWCRRTASTPVGWGVTTAEPPGDFETPFFRDDNWVWVQVTQLDTVDGDQDSYLHLFFGIEGVDYMADEIIQPANQFTPADLWTTTQWNDQLATGKVCRIPWFDGIDIQLTCHISSAANRPGQSNAKWYLFKWQRYLVPPFTDCLSGNIALLAYVDDNKSTAVDLTVAGNGSFAQRTCQVV